MDKKDVGKLKVTPINKHIVIEIDEVEDAKNSIVLPGNTDKKEMGKAFLRVTHIADDCEIVKVGDIVINKPGPVGKFNILDDQYIMLSEEDVAIVLREDS